MTMTSRERVLAALNHEEPDRVPIILGTSNATGIKMRPYRQLRDHLGIQAPDEVQRVIEILAPGGGYMLASVHTIMNEVPPQNILAMVDAAVEAS